MTRAEEPAGREVALRLEPQEAVTLSRLGWGAKVCMGAPAPMGLPARSLDSGHREGLGGPLTHGALPVLAGTPRGTSSPPSCLEATGPLFPTVEAPVCPAVPSDPGCTIQGPPPTFLLWRCLLHCLDHPGKLIKVGSGAGVSSHLVLGGVAGAGILFLRGPPILCTLPSLRTSPS